MLTDKPSDLEVRLSMDHQEGQAPSKRHTATRGDDAFSDFRLPHGGLALVEQLLLLCLG